MVEGVLSGDGKCEWAAYELEEDLEIAKSQLAQEYLKLYSMPVIEVTGIEVNTENKGSGTSMLKHLLEDFSEVPVIALVKFDNMSDLIQMEENPDYKKEFEERLIHFFSKNGFVDLKLPVELEGRPMINVNGSSIAL